MGRSRYGHSILSPPDFREGLVAETVTQHTQERVRHDHRQDLTCATAARSSHSLPASRTSTRSAGSPSPAAAHRAGRAARPPATPRAAAPAPTAPAARLQLRRRLLVGRRWRLRVARTARDVPGHLLVVRPGDRGPVQAHVRQARLLQRLLRAAPGLIERDRRHGDPPTGLPPRRPPSEPDPRKHLIADYRHREQQVTCVCGWVGSSQSTDGRHVQLEPPRRRRKAGGALAHLPRAPGCHRAPDPRPGRPFAGRPVPWAASSPRP